MSRIEGSFSTCAVTSTGLRDAANGTHEMTSFCAASDSGRQFEPAFLGRVGHQDAGAARHRHDRQPARRRQPAAGAGIGDIDQILRRLGALDGELAEGGVIDRVGPGQRRSVRGRRRRADGRGADLHRDDRLAVGARARHRLGKGGAVLDRLDIAGDRRRVGVVGEERDAVGDRTSASLPVDSQTPTEMPRRAVSANRCVPNAPDCVTMPSGPAGVGPSSRNELKVGVWPVRMLNRPRQFGPHSLMPPSRAICVMRVCISRPSAPISAKPAVNMTTALTPLATQNSIASTARLAGTAMTAHSTGPGIAAISGKAFSPCTWSRVGLIG